MRFLCTALVALACLSWTAAPSEARTRDQAQAQSRQAAPQANRATAARAAAAPQRREAASSRQAAARPAAATRQASASRTRDARGTRQAATRANDRQQAAANCRGRNCAPRTRTVSWQGGLEPATNAQAHACPSGTLATLAHGHANIVRCMPM